MMPMRFAWYDDDKTIMHYIIEGDWNWRDYHAGVRASIFSMHRHPHQVHALIDLRGSTRPALPSGAAAHMRSFGKRLAPALSGVAVVLGLPAGAHDALVLDEAGTLPTTDGRVYFVDSEDEALALLNELRS